MYFNKKYSDLLIYVPNLRWSLLTGCYHEILVSLSLSFTLSHLFLLKVLVFLIHQVCVCGFDPNKKFYTSIVYGDIHKFAMEIKFFTKHCLEKLILYSSSTYNNSRSIKMHIKSKTFYEPYFPLIDDFNF